MSKDVEYTPANSIKELVKERLLNDMINGGKFKSEWRILVVDKHCMRVISSCMRMFDITNNGITIVENLNMNRQPLVGFDALYFVEPTQETINFIVRDFENPSKPKYSAIHLFFSHPLSDALMAQLTESNAKRYIKTLREVNVDFLPVEAQTFSLDSPAMLHQLYSPVSNMVNAAQRAIAAQIATVCCALGELPIVRYSRNNQHNGVIASLVQDRLDEYLKYKDIPAPSGKQRSQLVILDRGLDPVSPLLHEMTYQAMAYDLLPIENDKINYQFEDASGSKSQKEALINEQDILWPHLRHLHIAKAINEVTTGFKEFVAKSKTKKLKADKVSVQQLSEALKDMPQHQEKMNKYSLHLEISGRCMKVFDEENLQEIAQVEQDMVMGEDAEGQKIKNHIPQIVPILQNDAVSVENKLRVLMLYVITKNGINDSDRQKLVEHAAIPRARQFAITNLSHLGVQVSVGESDKKKKKKQKRTERHEENVYTLSRWVPLLKDLMEQALENKLDKDEFSFVKEESAAEVSASSADSGATSLRSNKPGWATKNKDKKSGGAGGGAGGGGGGDAGSGAGGANPFGRTKSAGSKLIIFVIGGVSLAEVRAAYEVSQRSGRDVIIGSTHVLTPKSFLEQVIALDKPAAEESSSSSSSNGAAGGAGAGSPGDGPGGAAAHAESAM